MTRTRTSTAFLLALAAACGTEDPQPRAFSPVERPQLRLAEGISPAAPPKTWLSVDLGQPGSYEVGAKLHGFTSDPGDAAGPGLHKFYGSDTKSVRIPVAGRAGRLDRLRVRVHAQSLGLLELRWLRGRTLLGSADAQLFPESRTTTYTFEVPLAAPRNLDAIELLLHTPGPGFLGRVDFDELAVAQHLPQPPARPTWVRAVEDVRAAWGLATQAPLETSLSPAADSILVASAIVPQALRVSGSAPVLSLTLQGKSGEPRVHRWPLVSNEALSSAWVSIRVPLDDLAGAEVRARFELLTSGAEAICALTQPQVVRFDDSAPTVLLITSDTHRGDHLGCVSGSSGVATPVLDKLAARGVLFERCMSTTNVTIPSHAAIMTGIPPRDTGLLDNLHSLSPEAVTLAERFRENGWATIAAVSAAHLDAEWCGLGQGFDRVAVSTLPKRDAGATLSLLEDWVPDYRGRPLFLWLHLFDAHAPYTPPPPFDQRYWPQGTDPARAGLPEPPVGSIPAYFPGVRDPDWIRSRYRGEVAYLDSELSRLLDRSRFRSAIVAFTADHGESLGGHGVWWDHAGMYQDSLHVPLLLSWPGGPRGVRIPQRVSNLDLGRTLLDLAGLERAELPGADLLTTGGRGSGPGTVFALACFGLSATVTEGDEHLVLHLCDYELAPDAPRVRHASELYDFARDPDCVRDLGSERPQRARQLREKLVAWLLAAERRFTSQRPEGQGGSIAKLAALGYAQGGQPDLGAVLFPPQCDCAQCLAWR